MSPPCFTEFCQVTLQVLQNQKKDLSLKLGKQLPGFLDHCRICG